MINIRFAGKGRNLRLSCGTAVEPTPKDTDFSPFFELPRVRLWSLQITVCIFGHVLQWTGQVCSLGDAGLFERLKHLCFVMSKTEARETVRNCDAVSI